MADIVISMGGQTTTHTVTTQEQDRLVIYLTGQMTWDYAAEPSGPSLAQVAKFGTQYMLRKLSADVHDKEQQAASNTARNGVPKIVASEA